MLLVTNRIKTMDGAEQANKGGSKTRIKRTPWDRPCQVSSGDKPRKLKVSECSRECVIHIMMTFPLHADAILIYLVHSPLLSGNFIKPQEQMESPKVIRSALVAEGLDDIVHGQ